MQINLKVGDIVKTSYGTGPYRITRMRICEDYNACDFTGRGKHPPNRPHMHLTCKAVYLEGMDNPMNIEPPRQDFYLNNYHPETLRNIGPADGKLDPEDVCIPWQNDYLIVVSRSEIPMQETLF